MKKQKVAYLDRYEVEKIFDFWQFDKWEEFIKTYSTANETIKEAKENIINAILSLAINRDKIIEVLKKRALLDRSPIFDRKGELVGYSKDVNYVYSDKDIIKIADEIIGKDK